MERIPDLENLKDTSACNEVFAETIGVDPVLAMAEGREGEIPTAGWLLQAEVMPGSGGGAYIRIYKYSEGSFKASFLDGDSAQKRQVIRSDCQLTGGRYSLGYEAPNLAARSELPAGSGVDEPRDLEGVDSITLENSGRLFRGSSPMSAYTDGVVYNTSMTRRLPDGPVKEDEWLYINRAVLGIEEVGAVLVQIGAAMDLKKNDIHTLVTAAAEKISHLA